MGNGFNNARAHFWMTIPRILYYTNAPGNFEFPSDVAEYVLKSTPMGTFKDKCHIIYNCL